MNVCRLMRITLPGFALVGTVSLVSAQSGKIESVLRRIKKITSWIACLRDDCYNCPKNISCVLGRYSRQAWRPLVIIIVTGPGRRRPATRKYLGPQAWREKQKKKKTENRKKQKTLSSRASRPSSSRTESPCTAADYYPGNPRGRGSSGDDTRRRPEPVCPAHSSVVHSAAKPYLT